MGRRKRAGACQPCRGGGQPPRSPWSRPCKPGRFEVRAIEAEVVRRNRQIARPAVARGPVEGLPRIALRARGQQGGASLATQVPGRSPAVARPGLVARQGSAPPGSSPSRWLTMLAEVAAGKRESAGWRRCRRSSTAKLFAAASDWWPGVDYHLQPSRQGPGGSRSSCWAARGEREFGPVAREDRQQGLRSEAAHAGRRWGSKAASSLRSNCSLRARSSWRPVSGQRR